MGVKKFFLTIGTVLVVWLVVTVARYAFATFYPGIYSRIYPKAATPPLPPPPEKKDAISSSVSERKTPQPATTRADPELELYATGVVWRGPLWVVTMSDGSVRSYLDGKGPDAMSGQVTRHFIDWKGKRLWFRPHVTARPPEQPPSSSPTIGEPPRHDDRTPHSSWVTDPDGVTRLRKPSDLSDL